MQMLINTVSILNIYIMSLRFLSGVSCPHQQRINISGVLISVGTLLFNIWCIYNHYIINNWFMLSVCMGGGAVVWWLALRTSDLQVGGSSLVTAVVLFR